MTQPNEPTPGAPAGGDAGAEMQPESFNAPVSALGAGVKEGDTVSCQVVSVDQQSGVATLVVGQAEPSAGGTNGMADEFQSPGAGPETT